jgi:AcrR family transcriptional regulator
MADGAQDKPARAARLAPELRREQMLEAAAALALGQGVSACSLEAVAQAAGVSKALAYKYFPNRDALMVALIRREFEFMMGMEDQATREAMARFNDPETPIDEVLRLGVNRYVQYLVERGTLFRTLTADVGLAAQARAELTTGASGNIHFWRDRTMQAYGLPPDLARIGSIMATHALEGAQKSLRDGKISGERVAEFWTTFVQAGWKAVGAKYGKPLK